MYLARDVRRAPCHIKVLKRELADVIGADRFDEIRTIAPFDILILPVDSGAADDCRDDAARRRRIVRGCLRTHGALPKSRHLREVAMLATRAPASSTATSSLTTSDVWRSRVPGGLRCRGCRALVARIRPHRHGPDGGHFGYMAPEQDRGVIDRRSDAAHRCDGMSFWQAAAIHRHSSGHRDCPVDRRLRC